MIFSWLQTSFLQLNIFSAGVRVKVSILIGSSFYVIAVRDAAISMDKIARKWVVRISIVTDSQERHVVKLRQFSI
jgi:hypothetical protein